MLALLQTKSSVKPEVEAAENAEDEVKPAAPTEAKGNENFR